MSLEWNRTLSRLFIGGVVVCLILLIVLNQWSVATSFDRLRVLYGQLETNRTELQVKLPRFTLPRGDWFLNVELISPRGYQFTIDSREDCLGASACTSYGIQADLVTPQSPSIEADRSIPLSEDVEGWIVEPRCFGSCFPPQLIFDQNSIRYRFFAPELETLLEMGESMLINPIKEEDL